MKLVNILALRLVTTHRAARDLIESGQVSVNGIIIRNADTPVRSGDVIGYRGSLFTVGA